jgi:hypothetical protein
LTYRTYPQCDTFFYFFNSYNQLIKTKRILYYPSKSKYDSVFYSHEYDAVGRRIITKCYEYTNSNPSTPDTIFKYRYKYDLRGNIIEVDSMALTSLNYYKKAEFTFDNNPQPYPTKISGITWNSLTDHNSFRTINNKLSATYYDASGTIDPSISYTSKYMYSSTGLPIQWQMYYKDGSYYQLTYKYYHQ